MPVAHALFVLLTALAAEARAQDSTLRVDRGAVLDARGRRVPVDCRATAVVAHEGRIYVACGREGVWVLDAHHQLVEQHDVDGTLVDLEVHDGELRMIIRRPLDTRGGRGLEADVSIRGALALGAENDFVLFTTAHVGWRAPFPMAVRAFLEPFAWAAGNRELGGIAGYAVASWDPGVAEIGLGGGASTVDDDGSEVFPILVQLARLGRPDALHLTVRNGFSLRDRFEYASTHAEVAAPFFSEGLVLFRAGGAIDGHAHFELAYRNPLAVEVGGTLYFEGMIGGVWLFGTAPPPPGTMCIDSCGESLYRAGPALGIGFVWRE